MEQKLHGRSGVTRWLPRVLLLTVGTAVVAATTTRGGEESARIPLNPLQEQVLRGRTLVLTHDCGACHGGFANPAAEGWLAGKAEEPEMVGPFPTYPRNLTPDDETGLGRVTERQIYNALRYGLRPASTPDVDITSQVPGEGNHPANPDYLAPSMPWAYFRYMSDQELRDIAAYLKHGLRPVRHVIPPSEGPPDRWAGDLSMENIGGRELPPFPTEHEQLRDESRRDEVLHGRTLVAHHACAACHGGALLPVQETWLTGGRGSGPFDQFVMGPFEGVGGPFTTYPRNLTPDNATGLGRFSERQIFNALRWGLRPGETPDVEITSPVPGEGNHPVNPKYLAPPMPWFSFRHMSDEQLRAIAAYLKNGLRPVNNRVEDSEGPPDFWAAVWAPEVIGTYPVPPFPAAQERAVNR